MRSASPVTGLLLGNHPMLWIGAPLAPRARIELRTVKARDFHRQRVVARGDARAAVVHDFDGLALAEDGEELLFQLLRRLEGAVGLQVVVVEAVLRARDAACDRIDRFLLAAVAQRRARIEASAEAEDQWVAHVNAVADRTVFPLCNSWYLGANVAGKSRVFMPLLGYPPYVEKCKAVAARGYQGFVLT